MTGGSQNSSESSVKTKKEQSTPKQGEPHSECVEIEVASSQDWLPPEELKEVALKNIEAGKNLVLNLNSVDHLDASALQILLALEAEQKAHGSDLRFAHVSPELRQWIDHAGAAAQLSMDERKSDE